LNAISLNFLTGKFCFGIREIIGTNREAIRGLIASACWLSCPNFLKPTIEQKCNEWLERAHFADFLQCGEGQL